MAWSLEEPFTDTGLVRKKFIVRVTGTLLWATLLGGCAPENPRGTQSDGVSSPPQVTRAEVKRNARGRVLLQWEIPEGGGPIDGVQVEWFGSGLNNFGAQFVPAKKNKLRANNLDPEETYTFNLYVKSSEGQLSAPFTLQSLSPSQRVASAGLVKNVESRNDARSSVGTESSDDQEKRGRAAFRQQRRQLLQQKRTLLGQADSAKERRQVRQNYRQQLKELRAQYQGI